MDQRSPFQFCPDHRGSFVEGLCSSRIEGVHDQPFQTCHLSRDDLQDCHQHAVPTECATAPESGVDHNRALDSPKSRRFLYGSPEPGKSCIQNIAYVGSSILAIPPGWSGDGYQVRDSWGIDASRGLSHGARIGARECVPIQAIRAALGDVATGRDAAASLNASHQNRGRPAGFDGHSLEHLSIKGLLSARRAQDAPPPASRPARTATSRMP